MYKGKLKFCRLSVCYRLKTPLKPVEFIGSVIRGTLGSALRKNNCLTGMAICDGCEVYNTCAYHQIFEPTSLVQTNNGIKPQRLSPPLILQVNELFNSSEYSHEASKEFLDFELILVQPTIEAIVTVISALSSIEWLGKGDNRSLVQLHKLFIIDQFGSPLIGSLAEIKTSNEAALTFQPQFNTQAKPAVRVFLKTPLRTKMKGELMPPSELTGRNFLNLLMRRINTLNKEYSHSDQEAIGRDDFETLVDATELISRQLKWRDQNRYSARQQVSMKKGGICGELILQSSLPKELNQLLTIAKITNVGQNCVFGLGQIDFDYGRTT